MNRIACLLASSLTSLTFAQDAPPPATQPAAQSGFSLTVYSAADPATFDPQVLALQQTQYNLYSSLPPGFAVVREIRAIDLQQGLNNLRFTDVASLIDPTSVSFKSLTDPDASVLEQNYEFDLVSGEKMIEKYVDKPIVLFTIPSGNQLAERLEGTLLSADPYSVVLQSPDGQLSVLPRSQIGRVILARRDKSLITRPTLVWKLNATKPGPHHAEVTYQTDGITWRSDYNLVLNANDAAADLSAWVTLMNQSGASYPDAQLKLVAGDVQRFERFKRFDPYGARGESLFADADDLEDTAFKEKSFFEYHLYTLGRPTTIQQNATKQIELFPTRSNIPVEKTYVYYGLPRDIRYRIFAHPATDSNLGLKFNKKVDIYLTVHNTEQNGLGIPLPAGRVRVFKTDPDDGNREFIGEDVIQHTAKNERFMVRTGSAFDITGERKQTDLDIDHGDFIIESFEIKLRNHKTEPVTVIIKENLYRWTNWEITAISDKFEKQDFRTIHIPVQIPPEGEKTVTYTVKYTW